jgi:hypothetical protein
VQAERNGPISGRIDPSNPQPGFGHQVAEGRMTSTVRGTR